jgi:hypothetical protein
MSPTLQNTRAQRNAALARSSSTDVSLMSAIGTKRTCRVALHMSAFGVKRTWLPRRKMSAYDPKRTFGSAISNSPPSREVLGSLSKRGATCSGATSSDFSVARP